MVEDRITDGRRIAQLLASELEGRADLSEVEVADADPEVKPRTEGARAYDLELAGEEERIGRVYVHPDRARIEVGRDPDRVLEAVAGDDLRVRPRLEDPPRAVVFVESGAAVKRAADALAAVGSED